MTQLPGNDRITNLLGSFLDVQSRRAEITSANIANSETPGYEAKELDFADFLRRAAREVFTKRGDADGVTNIPEQPRVTFQLGNATRLDGNNVDMGREMTALAEAGKDFQAGSQFLQSRLRTLRTAIREGR